MSLLLQEIVKKIRLTSYQEFCDTVNKNLDNIGKEEKINIEKDQIKIMDEFKAQAIFQISCLQKRLIAINKELFMIQQNIIPENQEFQSKENNVEDSKSCSEQNENHNKEEIYEIKKENEIKEDYIEKERKNSSQRIYKQNVLNKINMSNSQDISPVKNAKSNQMNLTYSNYNPKRIERTPRRTAPSKNSSDFSKSSSSSISYSRCEIRHMEKNSDIYHQKIAKFEKENESIIFSESSQRSVSVRRRKHMERLIHNFKEEVKSIGSHYPKNKKIKS